MAAGVRLCGARSRAQNSTAAACARLHNLIPNSRHSTGCGVALVLFTWCAAAAVAQGAGLSDQAAQGAVCAAAAARQLHMMVALLEGAGLQLHAG
jgi:hypothetical protein